MGLFSFLSDLFSDDHSSFSDSGLSIDSGSSMASSLWDTSKTVINPTTGLPMASNSPAGYDAGGYFYGEVPEHHSELDNHGSCGLDDSSIFDSGNCFDSGSSFDCGSSFGSGLGDW